MVHSVLKLMTFGPLFYSKFSLFFKWNFQIYIYKHINRVGLASIKSTNTWIWRDWSMLTNPRCRSGFQQGKAKVGFAGFPQLPTQRSEWHIISQTFVFEPRPYALIGTCFMNLSDTSHSFCDDVHQRHLCKRDGENFVSIYDNRKVLPKNSMQNSGSPVSRACISREICRQDHVSSDFLAFLYM